MNMARTVSALSVAIDAYVAKHGELSAGDKAMLDLIRAGGEATLRFADLQLSGPKSIALIGDFVTSYRLANGEHARQVRAHSSAARDLDPEKARDALAEVERFFRGGLYKNIPSPQPPDPPKSWAELAGRTYIRGPDPGPIGEAIALLARAIKDEERYREEHKPPRKGDDASAHSRAILWIKQSVARLSGAPNHKAVRAFAVAVTDRRYEDLTIDDVKNAGRNAGKKEH
jgi:hypothetical protein